MKSYFKYVKHSLKIEKIKKFKKTIAFYENLWYTTIIVTIQKLITTGGKNYDEIL